MNAVQSLRELIGDSAVLDPETLSERAAGVWNPAPMQGLALARPSTTEEVSAVMKWCSSNGIGVVTQGGLTGLVHGADTSADQVILSLERMNKIESIDPQQRCATVQAGVILQTFQEKIEEDGMIFPLDLGARGTATLGGNAATNAGGNRVIRYGMMRAMVLGLEVVLADGTIVSSMNTLVKNNAAYDLKQMFIGSEGTLGVITRLVLKLYEAPITRNMAFVGLEDFNQVSGLLKHMDRSLGGALSAFEVMWQNFYKVVTTEPAQGRPPIAQDYPYYVLIESQGADRELDTQRFESALESAYEAELITDAAISQSEADCERFWALRDDVEQVVHGGVPLGFDISLPIGEMESYISNLAEVLPGAIGEHKLFVFGHLGDGNLHVVVQVPAASAQSLREPVEKLVYEPLAAFKGSVSAEHGIGLEKKPWLHISRSAEEIALMRTLKQALDPNNILNPGKVI